MDGITEERFVELMLRIPIMEEKLDRVLSALNRMETNDSLKGFNRSTDGDPFEFSESKVEEDEAAIEVMNLKRSESQRLKNEADAIERELDM